MRLPNELTAIGADLSRCLERVADFMGSDLERLTLDEQTALMRNALEARLAYRERAERFYANWEADDE